MYFLTHIKLEEYVYIISKYASFPLSFPPLPPLRRREEKEEDGGLEERERRREKTLGGIIERWYQSHGERGFERRRRSIKKVSKECPKGKKSPSPFGISSHER